MPRMHIITFDLKTGQATRQLLAPTIGDFPQVPPQLLGTLPAPQWPVHSLTVPQIWNKA